MVLDPSLLTCCFCSGRFHLKGNTHDAVPHFVHCGHSACKKCISESNTNTKLKICTVCGYSLLDEGGQRERLHAYFQPNYFVIGKLYYYQYVDTSRNKAIADDSFGTDIPNDPPSPEDGRIHRELDAEIIERAKEVCESPQIYKTKLSEALDVTSKSIFNVKSQMVTKATGLEFKKKKSELHHYFGKATLFIQKEELRLMADVDKHEKELHTKTSNYFRKCLSKLTSGQRTLERILEEINSNFSKHIFDIRVPLARNIVRALKTPCVYKKREDCCRISYRIDDQFFKNIDKYCVLNSEYIEEDLLPMNDCDESKIDATLEEIVETTPLKIDCVELVKLVHLVSPHEFYLQRTSQVMMIDKLKNDLRETVPKSCKLNEIVQGKLYATYDEAACSWFRVTIIGKPQYAKIENQVDYYLQAKFVDFGHRAKVLASTIGSLEERFAAIPHLAVQCFLPCVPVQFQWSTEDIEMMRNIFDGSADCYMLPRRLCEHSTEVDVYTVPQDFHSGIPVSVAAALCFLGYAKYPKTYRSHKFQNPVKVEVSTFKTDTLTSNDKVNITFIPNPNVFFVRKMDWEGEVNKISDVLNEQYDLENREYGMIYHPTIGLSVACFTEKYQWCRATIERVEDLNTVIVFLVDYGDKEIVPWFNIRSITMDLFNIPQTAIKCKLENISSVTKRKETEALNLLKLCAASAVPSSVEVVKTRDNLHEIILTATIKGRSKNINKMFLKRDFAIPVRLENRDDQVDTENASNVGRKRKAIKIEGEQPAAKVRKVENTLTISQLLEKSDRLNVQVYCADNPSSILVKLVKEEFPGECNGTKCHLSDIVPPCGETWPNMTCEYLQDVVSSNEQFYIVKDGDMDDGSLPIKLWTLVVEEGGALEPTTEEWRSVNEMIVQEGLAVRGRNVLTKKAKIEWPQSALPASRSFRGRVRLSFFDDDFSMYLHLPKIHDRLEAIGNLLAETFENSKASADDTIYSVGDVCIAQSSTNNKFYRGVVEKVDDGDKVTVRFVDYGKCEECRVPMLRKFVVGEDIPIQVFKCKIAGVKPQGQDLQKMFEYIHSEIDDRDCSITMLAEDSEGTTFITLKVDDVIDLTDLLNIHDFIDIEDF